MTTRRSRRGALAMILLSAVVGTPAAQARPAHDPALRAVLLRPADVAPQYATVASTDTDALFCGADPTGATTAEAFEALTLTSAGGYGSYVYQTIARFRPGRATTVMRQAAAQKGCTESTASGTQVTQVRPLAAPRIGDESLAVRVTQIGGPLTPLVYETVLIRKGDVLATLSTFALVGRAPSGIALARKLGARLTSLA